MGRDALEGDGLKGLLAVNEERVDSVAEAGGPAAPTGPSTRTSSEATVLNNRKWTTLY